MSKLGLSTLEQMANESLKNRPEQADAAVVEYISIVEQQAQAEIRRNLLDKEYLANLKVAITYTSLIVFVMALKVTQQEMDVDFEKYLGEFLSSARNDDKSIYDMRVHYLSKLDADAMGLGEEADDVKESYNQFISNIKGQYINSQTHLE